MELKKLKEYEREGSFITVKSKEAWLVKKNGQWIFDVKIGPDSEICTNLKEREDHFRSYSSDWLKEKLELQKRINRKELKMEKIRVADPEHPLEMVGGVACLILEIEGKEYCVNSLRDIYPKGWLLPGGTSDNLWEISHPRDIAYRELSEEIKINGERVFIDKKDTPFLKRINAVLSEISFLSRIGHAQHVIVREENNGLAPAKGIKKTEVVSITKNITIGIDSEVGSVVACIFPKITLPYKFSEVTVSDNEKKGGRPLNRPTRLVNIQDGTIGAIFIKDKNVLLKENKSIFRKNFDVLNVGWSCGLMRQLSNISPYI